MSSHETFYVEDMSDVTDDYPEDFADLDENTAGPATETEASPPATKRKSV